jgi:DUF1680 family protein
MQKVLRVPKLRDVRVNGSFWGDYISLIIDTVLPYQWEALNDRIPDIEPSHAVENFRIAAKLSNGKFHGEVFQDSDVAKWIEAVAYSLETHPNAALERTVDELIELIAKAQHEDGYLNTYFSTKGLGKQWSNLYECHELYCAGHMIEAAVAYMHATGKTELLDVMCRTADCIDRTFGPLPEQIHGYPGHQEVELALVKLYAATGCERYLCLANYFLHERGKQPSFFIDEWEGPRDRRTFKNGARTGEPDLCYNQSHVPVTEQPYAVGHAVRAVYMYSAMADLARETGDSQMLQACRRLWNDMTCRQMYITGAIGSTHIGEAFTCDYDLPNTTAYAESCASVGLIFFAHRMLQIDQKSDYADIMEKALYNVILASMSTDGKHYFYVNPLEVWPEASEHNPDRYHVKPERQGWFGCACCPPNIARLLTSLNQYIYSSSDDTLYVHLYINSEIEKAFAPHGLRLRQKTGYPWSGHVEIEILDASEAATRLALRIPEWSENWSVRVNGAHYIASMENGYAVLNNSWRAGDTITLELTMQAKLMRSNPRVRENASKVAIQRGPLIYCLEQVDNGENLSAIRICNNTPLTVEPAEELAPLALAILAEGVRVLDEGWGDKLYDSREERSIPVKVRAIPYYLWGNRGTGEMCVWIHANGNC